MFVVTFKTETFSNAETPKKRSAKRLPQGSRSKYIDQGGLITIDRVDAKSYPEAIALCRRQHPILGSAKVLEIKRSR